MAMCKDCIHYEAHVHFDPFFEYDDKDVEYKCPEFKRNDEKWCDASVEIPVDEETDVLLVVSGKHDNITYNDAVMLGKYVNNRWYIMGIGEAEGHGFTVSYWMPIPPTPFEGANGTD